MNLDKKLLVCEAMLARLDAAMAGAEAEAVQASALEDHLGRLLENFEAEQAQIDHDLRVAGLARDIPTSARVEGVARPDDTVRLGQLNEQMSRIRAVQNRLHVLLDAAEGVAAQQP